MTKNERDKPKEMKPYGTFHQAPVVSASSQGGLVESVKDWCKQFLTPPQWILDDYAKRAAEYKAEQTEKATSRK